MKHTLINSVSLIAVTAMLAGCSESKNSDKSNQQVLQQEAIQQSKALATLAGDVLEKAETIGVPAPSEVENILQKAKTPGVFPEEHDNTDRILSPTEEENIVNERQNPKHSPEKPQEMVSALFSAFGDLDRLTDAANAPSIHSKRLSDTEKAMRKELALKAKLYIEKVKNQEILARANIIEAKLQFDLARTKLELLRAQEERSLQQLEIEEATSRAELALPLEEAKKRAAILREMEQWIDEFPAQLAQLLKENARGDRNSSKVSSSTMTDEVIGDKTGTLPRRENTQIFEENTSELNPKLQQALNNYIREWRKKKERLARSRTSLSLPNAEKALQDVAKVAAKNQGLQQDSIRLAVVSSILEGSGGGRQGKRGVFEDNYGVFSPDSSDSDSTGGLTITGRGAKNGRVDFALPLENSNGVPVAVSAFSLNLLPFARLTENVVEDWLGSHVNANSQLTSGVVATVSGQAPDAKKTTTTDEASRLIMLGGLNSSTFSGVAISANADPELVASFTNVTTLAMIQKTEAFKALSDTKQQLALKAALAVAHSARAGDPLGVEDRVNALLIAIDKLPESGDNASRIATVREALEESGVTNPLLLTDTLRSLNIIVSTSALGSQEQARIMGSVLMIANNTSGGDVSDADFEALVTVVRTNPALLLGNRPTVPMPARFTIDPELLTILRTNMQSIDKLPWTASSTSAAFIQAANAGARQFISQGGKTQDRSSGALVTGLRAAREEKKNLRSDSNNSLDIFVGAQGSSEGISLVNVVELLPTNTALAILSAGQDEAVRIASNARSNVLGTLAITDSNSASAAPADPKVELESFVRIYKQQIGSPQAGLLLKDLKRNIESIKGKGHFEKFADVPDEKGKDRNSPGLMELCDLGEHLELLYSANDYDITIMPQLVKYILNSKNGLVSKLSYRTNGTPGTKRPFASMRDGTNGELYQKYLIELGKQIDTYLTNMRDFVMSLVRPQASRFEELEETALIARALSDTNLGGLSESVTMREARMGIVGVDARGISVNGVSGEHMDLGIPLFVKINGDISSAKTTDAFTGAVAYRLGNTVLGVIQGYANSGDGFTGDSRQLETSVLASQNFGAFFIEGQ